MLATRRTIAAFKCKSNGASAFRIRSNPYQRRLNSTSPKHEPTKPQSSTTPSSSPAPAAEPAARSAFTIPIPSWLWIPLKPLTYPISAFNQAQKTRPYLTQIVSSIVIYSLGDLSSQFIQRPTSITSDDASTTKAGEPSFASIYDPTRTLRAFIIGAVISIPSYKWFLYLSSLFPTYTHLPRLALQVGINQAVFAPFINTYFFSMQSFLASVFEPETRRKQLEAGGTFQAVVRRVQDTLPASWWNSCKFWPVVTAFSFTFVQPRSRSIFAGVVAVGWQSYLGILNQRAVREEAERHAAAASASGEAPAVLLASAD